MAIEWRENLATGNEKIDDQHKELFKRFNNLLAACNQGKGKEEVNMLLLFLGDYVRSHFATEEQLQVQYSYPGYQAHKKEHEGFIRDLQNLDNDRVFADPRNLAALQANALEKIKNWEFDLRKKAEGAENQTLSLSGSDEVPAEFRKQIEEYYRTISKSPLR